MRPESDQIVLSLKEMLIVQKFIDWGDYSTISEVYFKEIRPSINTKMHVDFSFVADSMLSLPDQACCVSFFYIKGESPS